MARFIVITPEEILELEEIDSNYIPYKDIQDIIADDVYQMKSYVGNMPITIFYGDASSNYEKPLNLIAKSKFPELPLSFGNIVITGALEEEYLGLDKIAINQIRNGV